jgi:tRNA G18 (ribose-2'-O)-methylase SpoU
MPNLIPIDDPGDPRIAAYAEVRERDLVGRQGCFMAEGEVVLRVLATRSRFPVKSVLLSEKRVVAVEPLLKRLPSETPVFVTPQEVMSRVAGFPIHRGVLALGRRAPEPAIETLLATGAPRPLVVGLVGIANHDNVGGVFRNAAAFGAHAVCLDDATCDPLYRKAIRVSVGASLIVPFARTGSASAMADALAKAGFDLLALSPRGAKPLMDIEPRGPTALLLGAEGAGLPPEILARARGVRIPMREGFDSLNVATASGIALHHLMTKNDARA